VGTVLIDVTGTQTGTAYVFATYEGTLDTTGVTVAWAGPAYSVDWNYLGGNQAAIIIPEPSTLLLVGCGLVGVLLLRRARRR
jgi:hypothetical protein